MKAFTEKLNDIDADKEKLKSKFQDKAPRENMFIRVSNCEAYVSSILKDIDPGIEASYTIPNTKYVADFYLPESKTLIEVNGPSHYIKRLDPANPKTVIVSHDLNGRTLAKQRKIESLGYKQVTINYT